MKADCAQHNQMHVSHAPPPSPPASPHLWEEHIHKDGNVRVKAYSRPPFSLSSQPSTREREKGVRGGEESVKRLLETFTINTPRTHQ